MIHYITPTYCLNCNPPDICTKNRIVPLIRLNKIKIVYSEKINLIKNTYKSYFHIETFVV